MNLVNLLVDSAKRWYKSDMKSYAAAFSYYAPLAIVPILLFSISLVGIIYGENVTRQILTDWAGVLSQDIVDLIKSALSNLRQETESFAWPIVGIIFFLSISILALNVLANGFHRLWQNQSLGFRNWLKKSQRSFLFILIFQLYLIIVIGFELFLISNDLRSYHIIPTVFLFISTSAFFVILFKFLADNAPSWKGCLVGAVISSTLFIITKSTIGVYVASVSGLNVYGAAGLILVLLLWVYILASLIYYGAAIAYEYDKYDRIQSIKHQN
ncbi:MAG: YihY/virulence factor BrkB family protein [Candidatus Paceibacterota bacterium]